MTKTRKLMTAALIALALATGLGIAQAMGDDSSGEVTGTRAERPGQAALRAVGADMVTRVERSNAPNAAWEVAVFKREDSLDEWPAGESKGRRIEVLLDRDLTLVQAVVTGYGGPR